MSHQYQESDINSLFLVKLSLFHFQNKADDDGHNTLLHIMQVISVVSSVSCHESWPFVLEFLPNRPPSPTMNKKDNTLLYYEATTLSTLDGAASLSTSSAI